MLIKRNCYLSTINLTLVSPQCKVYRPVESGWIKIASCPARVCESHRISDVELRRCAVDEKEENTPQANVKESFHWLFDTPAALPVSCMKARTLFLSLSCQVLLYIVFDDPEWHQ